ncbi:MAG: aminodeoxychorismate synthase component I [Clostridium sp.]|nr:aminodeoxychorismate synthase component I [Clostridium sp.]
MNFKINELEKNLNPFYVYNIFKDELNSVFLDSSKEDKNLSKFSFIGINPFCNFTYKNGNGYINGEEIQEKDPFIALEKLVNKYKINYDSNIPFVGGAIGYFSYDIGRTIEVLPSTAKKKLEIPDAIFNFYNNLIIFDLQNKKTFISSLGMGEEIEDIEEKLKDYKDISEPNIVESNNKFISNFEKEDYEKEISKLREYIRSGDVYIANMTRQVWCYNKEDSFSIYEKLRSINKAPFSVYMNFKDFQVISSSPERFLYVKDGIVHTRPIKGTRPRGKNSLEDMKNRKALENSEKDKAELLMIVDLERNDLSKVCKPNSVKVTELFKIEEYATVFHLVSTIEGELENGVSAVKCIRECFPGGSITGAPKIRAMEIIEELEKIRRNLYTGSIGYFDLRGNCDFNIVIRTIIKKDDKAYFGVGGGITWDSKEEDEWFETIDKGKALMRVL